MRTYSLYRHSLFLIFFLCGFAAHADAQSSFSIIHGTISDSQSTPIPYASVAIVGSQFGAVTNEAGQFQFQHYYSGNVVVLIRCVGYDNKQINLTVAQGESIQLSEVLTESLVGINEVVVTSQSKAAVAKQNGFEIESIDVRTFQSQSIELNTLLSQVPGVQVRSEGGLGSRTSYAINGLGGRSVRFFIDGIPMECFGASYSMSTIPVSQINRIDVYKGVTPIELGSDALGGAINLISKQKADNSAEMNYSYGSFNTHRFSLLGNWRNPANGFTTKLAAFYNYSDNNYKVWGDDIYVTDPVTYEIKRGIKVERFHDAFESKAVRADVGFTDKKWADQLLFSVLLSNLDKDIQQGTTMEVPYGEAVYRQRSVMPYLQYHKAGLLANKMDVKLFASYSDQERARVDTSVNIYNWYGQVEGQRVLGGEQNRSFNTLNEDVFLTRGNVVFHINKNYLLGYNQLFSSLVRKEEDQLITQKSEGYWAPQTLNKNSFGLTLQSAWLNQNLKTLLFVKWFGYNAAIKSSETTAGVTTYQTVHSSTSTPGFGFAGSYKPADRLMLTTSFESAHRLPEANEILGDGLSVMGTTTLRPESSLNANLGFDYKLLDDKEHKANLDANFYYRQVTDLIQQYQYDLGAFVYINFDRVTMKGVDVAVQYKYTELLTINQSVSYLNPIINTDKDEVGNDNITEGTRLPNTPFFQTNTSVLLNAGHWFSSHPKISVYWNMGYVGEYYKHSEVVGEYNKDLIVKQLINSIGAGYTTLNDKIAIGIDVNNLFNQQLFDNYALQKPGRAVFVKITYKFL